MGHEAGKPAATIVQDAKAALAGVSSVAVHYTWVGDGPSVDERYVVTIAGSSPYARPSDCMTVQGLVAAVEFDPRASVVSSGSVGGSRIIQLGEQLVWSAEVLNSSPPYPLELSFLASHGRATYDFSDFNAPANVLAPAGGCPPPTPTPPVTSGFATMILSGAASGSLSGDAICDPGELSLIRPTGTASVNGQASQDAPILNLYLTGGPPYQTSLRFLSVEFDGTIVADHLSGPMLHAHFAGTLKGGGGSVQLSLMIRCDGVPSSAVH